MTRILIVEDDPAQMRALTRAFSKLRPDFTIETANNGIAATRVLSEHSVSAVLTDLQMPEMDGFELLAWMHNNQPNVSVFTMSAYEVNGSAARLSGLGANEHFEQAARRARGGHARG